MTNQNTHTDNHLPVKTFRDRAISLSIWANPHTDPETGDTKLYYSLSLQRGYKKGDTWNQTTSINGDDALRVSSLYQEAHRWLLAQKYAPSAEQPQAAEMQQPAETA